MVTTVKNKFRYLAGLDVVDEAIEIDNPLTPQPQQNVQPTSTPPPIPSTSVQTNKKFWLVLPTSKQATEQDMLAHVTVGELFNIFRGSLWGEKDGYSLFSDNEESQARQLVQQRLSQNQPEEDQFNPDDQVAPDVDEFSDNESSEASAAAMTTDHLARESVQPKLDILNFNVESDPKTMISDIKFSQGEKIKIPGIIKTSLVSAIKRATDDLTKSQTRATLDDRTGMERPADVDFYIDLLNAYQKIDQLLKDGTTESLKQLQMFIPSLPNWMTKEIPADVVKFIATGGKNLSLADRFKEIKLAK